MTALIYSWLFSLLAPLGIVFGVSLFLGFRGYKQQKNERYSVLTMFPQELYDGKDPMRVSARLFLYVYALVDAIAAAYPLFIGTLPQGLIPLGIVYLGFIILRDVTLVAITHVPAYEFKPHLLSFTCFGGFGVMGMVLSCILFANQMAFHQTLAITFMVLSGIVGIAEFALLANPRLGHWTKLNATVDAEGNVDTSRPKPFVLAFTEWLLIFLALAGTLITVLGGALLGLASM